MYAAWRKEDPPPDRVKPVPIPVIKRINVIASAGTNHLMQGIADMIVIAFFFLLRPGEYTNSRSDTTPFRLADVQLFVGQTCLHLVNASTNELRSATFATLTFTTQKNGVRNEVVGLGRSGDPVLCPVTAIIRRVLHLRRFNAPPETPLSTAFHNNQWRKVLPSHITTALRDAVTFLPSLGFLPTDVSARCLRAAGANALLCAKVDTDIIRLLGRWRSDEMLRYLTLQAAPIMSNFAANMLAGGNFTLIPNQLVPMVPAADAA